MHNPVLTDLAWSRSPDKSLTHSDFNVLYDMVVHLNNELRALEDRVVKLEQSRPVVSIKDRTLRAVDTPLRTYLIGQNCPYCTSQTLYHEGDTTWCAWCAWEKKDEKTG